MTRLIMCDDLDIKTTDKEFELESNNTTFSYSN